MKKLKIFYWVFTLPFVAFMLFSAVPDLLVTADAHKFMTALGYNDTVTRFLGVAKILGCIAILIPGLPRLKEWAYAGLFYDLVGATVSMAGSYGVNPGMSFMLLPISFLFGSYIFYHKLNGA
ncbi:MAG: DoxX family protein [Chitinophagales bacterium]|nr:DoxX family protein [Chitinophagales bacterium]